MESARAIQIIALKNHTFQLQTETLRSIVSQDFLLNRNLVAVSIAGAFRKGKSFLLNFFLKFLYAQYVYKDATNWISRNDTAIHGFKARGGPERETLGIWMWSDVFTYDYENGEKVAIILLDTQGIFDDESTPKDCTGIFAISMMTSSVQCYNLMQNVQEDDLQHLQLFTEYGRRVMEQSTEKPFQNLMFLIRDWPYPDDYAFGNGQSFIDQKLIGNGRQAKSMLQLRQQIRDSFEKIGAFLLPSPGERVILAKNVSSIKIDEINSQFIKHVEELVPSVFAPENLVVKKINGQKIRVGNLITYLQSYVKTFNSGDLPEPQTVFMATAEASNQILYSECMKHYSDSMGKSIERVPYFEEADLLDTHKEAKESSLLKFQERRKLGDETLISSFREKLVNEIESKFQMIASSNEKQRKAHIEKEKAKEKARIEAQQRAEAEKRAREEAQQRAAAEERARIAAQQKAAAEQTARKEAQQRAAAEERARKEAEQRAQAEKRANQERERRIEAEREAERARKSNGLLGVVGAVAGGLIGGPAGAAIGYGAGNLIDN